MTAAPPFRYEGYHLDPGRSLLTCRYSLGGRAFAEKVSFGSADRGRWESAAARQAARLVFLLAGVSYYKTAAPEVIDLGATAVSDAERAFLREFYIEGLGEFAYKNGLDLTGLRITGGAEPGPAAPGPAGPGTAPVTPAADPAKDGPGTAAAAVGARGALIPFGGGIDSIVTVEMMRPLSDSVLFVMSRPGEEFDAIEAPAAVTGLPVVRAGREIDPQLLRSAELGFLNGHVPITGILSAIAVMAAVLDGRDAVVMSNEWSASIATLEDGGRAINHQYSKSERFETAFRRVLDAAFGGEITYFSALRPFTELWVARKFAALTEYHGSFRSCNRAFHIDPARRLDHWCGQCDKCCFIDLILAPFLPAEDLSRIFGGREPLGNASLAEKFRALLGASSARKPFECVGEVGECRAAAHLAARRADRAGHPLLRALTADLPPLDGAAVDALLRPVGAHAIPDAYATADLLV